MFWNKSDSFYIAKHLFVLKMTVFCGRFMKSGANHCKISRIAGSSAIDAEETSDDPAPFCRPTLWSLSTVFLEKLLKLSNARPLNFDGCHGYVRIVGFRVVISISMFFCWHIFLNIIILFYVVIRVGILPLISVVYKILSYFLVNLVHLFEGQVKKKTLLVWFLSLTQVFRF